MPPIDPALDTAQAIGRPVGSGIAPPSGIHMEDWAKGPAPWLNAIKYGAGIGTSAATTATATAGTWGVIAGTGLNMVVGTIMDGVDAYDSQKTIAELKRIRDRELPKLDPHDQDDLGLVLDVAIRKKTRHRDIAISQAATLQISKVGTAAYRTVRAIHKWRTGTKGQSRDDAANVLIRCLEDDFDPVAHNVALSIVRVLCKKNFEDLLKSSIKESLRS